MSNEISKKLHFAKPTSMVILNPIFLNILIVSFLFFKHIIVLFIYNCQSIIPIQAYFVFIVQGCRWCNMNKPMRLQSSAPKKDPIGTLNSVSSSVLVQLMLLCVMNDLHVCCIIFMSLSGIIIWFLANLIEFCRCSFFMLG